MAINRNLHRGPSKEIDNLIDKNLDKGLNYVTEDVKKDLFEIFTIDQSAPVETATNQITKIRTAMVKEKKQIQRMEVRKWEDWVIRWGGINIKDYPDVYQRYNETLSKFPEGTEREDNLREIDEELAVRFVLNERLHSSAHIFTRRASFDTKDYCDKMFDKVKDKYPDQM